MLQKQSKDFIRKKANESDLFKRADEQVKEHLATLNWLLQDAGWEIEIKESRNRTVWN
jgi:hypothetical protein